MKQRLFKKLAVFSTALVTASAFAQTAATGPNLDALKDAFNPATTIAAILAIAGILIGIYVAIRASRFVLGMIRGA